ncbi:MAG: hypothetical protein L0Y60_09585 [Beijerinckiaceae bacterium]|nr:hypothetical protein [Beijerinckiaceae bacterium]
MSTELELLLAECAGFKADIRALCAELRVDIAKMKTDVLKWFLGALCVQTGVIVSALVWFVKRIVQ